MNGCQKIIVIKKLGGLLNMKNHDELFHEYVNDLQKAIEYETNRTDKIKENNRKRFKTKEEFDDFVKKSIDPISCSGRVIAVFRKYWLECDKTNISNDSLGNGEYVNPKDFTVDWLSGEYENLYNIIEDMPYYPIGIDEEGNYC